MTKTRKKSWGVATGASDASHLVFFAWHKPILSILNPCSKLNIVCLVWVCRYGAKLTSIFSTSFKVETVDALRKKKYVQEWCNNMNDVDPPKISACSLKPYTRVTFVPDYRRFSVSNMTEGIYKVFEKRVYDLAASTPADLTVTLNGTVIKMKGFDKYVDWWLGPRSESPRVYEKLNDRWEVAVAVSPDGRYNQVSFVNGIVTNLGGRHVDHVTNQVTKKLVEHISKKKKKTVKPAWIRDNIWVFVNCVVESPSFSSQTKVRPVFC